MDNVNIINAEVNQRGLTIPLGLFKTRIGGEVLLRKILNAMCITEKPHPGRPRGMARLVRKAYIVERINGIETLIIPRIKGLALLKAKTKTNQPFIDFIQTTFTNIIPRKIAEERLISDEPLYDYQEAAISYICNVSFNENNGVCGGVAYLQMDTGLGKTRVGCGVIARRGEPALVVVPTDAIANQWVDEFAEIYPELKVDVYHNPPKGSRKIPPSPLTHDVIIIIINTYRDKTSDFIQGFGTIILDEAHEYHSASNSKALWLSQTRAVLGLSATPEERQDGLDKYINLHLGPVIYPKNIPGFDVNAVNFQGEAHIIEYSGHPTNCETVVTPAGTMSAILTIGNIIKDYSRLQLVAIEAERIFKLHETASSSELLRLGLGPRPIKDATSTHPAGGIRRHGVFIFAEHREYLPILREILLKRLNPTEILVPEHDEDKISVLRGGAHKNAVGDAKRAGSHIVLTTYGFSRRGISLPDMTCIIEATPRRNGMRQILGRILRRGSDESIVRQIIDIVDVRTGLKGQINDRRKIYTEKKYSILKRSATWEDYTDNPETDNLETDKLETDFSTLSIDELLDMAIQ